MPANRVVTLAAIAIGVALCAYAALLGFLYLSQEKMIFAGSRLPDGYRFSFPAQKFEEVRVNVPGAQLHALHFMQPAPRGLVFFLHGNGGDLSTWTTGIDFYEKVGYDLFIFDYRGYGLSSGRIENEAQLHADVRAMWNTIAPSYAARNLPIVVYGRSLGTGLAVPLARDVDPKLLVLVTPFSSLASLVHRLYPFAPSSLLRYPLRSDVAIEAVKSPILMLHGTSDELIPVAEAEALMTQAKAPAELIRIDGAHHNDIQEFPAYREALAQRLVQVAAH